MSSKNQIVVYLNSEQKADFIDKRATVVAQWFKSYGVKPTNAEILVSSFRLLHDKLTEGKLNVDIRQNLHKYERIRTPR